MMCRHAVCSARADGKSTEGWLLPCYVDAIEKRYTRRQTAGESGVDRMLQVDEMLPRQGCR